MKRFVIIDDCTTQRAACYEEPLPRNVSREEAEEAIRFEWAYLGGIDKRARDAYYLVLADLDDCGYVDYNTAEEIIRLK